MRRRRLLVPVLGTALSFAAFLCATAASAQCTLPSCLQVVDGNLDGDLTAEFQQAVNDLVYPSGVLTTELEVFLDAPPPGEYILSDTVRICFDSSPPLAGGEDPGDCTGLDIAGAFPKVSTSGDWSSATLRCVMAELRTGSRSAWGCLHVGDAYDDATLTDIGPVIEVDFASSPLRMTMEESGIISFLQHARGMSALHCDGCTGEIDGHFTIGGDLHWNYSGTGLANLVSLANTSSLHLVGPGITATGTFDLDPIAGHVPLTSVTFDGEISGSSLVGSVVADAPVVLGSNPATFNGPKDGCAYGSFDQPCRSWSLASGALLDVKGHDVGGLWITEWEDVHIDGEIDSESREDRKQFSAGHLYDVKAAINLSLGGQGFTNIANGSFFFDGVCRNRGVISECIRVFNSEANRDPAYPTEIILNGLIDRPNPLHDPTKPELDNAARIGGFVGVTGAEVTFGPSFQFTGANQAVTSSVGGAFLTDPIEQELDVTIDVAAPPALPRCVNWNNGNLIPCNKAATKRRLTEDSYLAVTRFTVNQDVPSDTACSLRYRVSGDCVTCEPGAVSQQAPVVLDGLETIDPARWSFEELTDSVDSGEFNEGSASLRLDTDASLAGHALWTPAAPLDIRRQYLQFDVWTDPAAVIDAQAFEHKHFSDTDGFRLGLTDTSGAFVEWSYGGPESGSVGLLLSRLGLGGWSRVTLQHWFDTPDVDDPDFDYAQVASVRFQFNTHVPTSGRTFRLDNVRTVFREGNAILYGIEFGPIRTQQAGDVWEVQVPARVPADQIVQLEVSEPASDFCADGLNCACNSIHATVDSGMIVVDDQGDRFDRIAAGFHPGSAPRCGLGFEVVPFLFALRYLRRRRIRS